MKNLIPQLSIAVVAFAFLTLLMSYTRPTPDGPKEYTIVTGYGPLEVEKEVKKKLSEGWRLQGGVATGNMVTQAMVR